jgi:hypothetical protein
MVTPNPSRAGSPTQLTLRREGPARATIVDATGRLVRRAEGAGPRHLEWDGRDGGGRPAAAGVYFVALEQVGETSRLRITVVR